MPPSRLLPARAAAALALLLPLALLQMAAAAAPASALSDVDEVADGSGGGGDGSDRGGRHHARRELSSSSPTVPPTRMEICRPDPTITRKQCDVIADFCERNFAVRPPRARCRPWAARN